MIQRVIITGANGSGKSHVARRLGAMRPEIPVVSFDALRLTTGWRKRPRDQSDLALQEAITSDSWVLEGGPSLMPHALDRAQGVIWIDPPKSLRAWRLFVRPLKGWGKTRPELPDGNVDWPLEQYRFAWRSLRNDAHFTTDIADVFQHADHLVKWRCRDTNEIERAVRWWSDGAIQV